MSRQWWLSLRRAWEGLRKDGWVRTWDRSCDFFRRKLPWVPRHRLAHLDESLAQASRSVPCAADPLVSIIIPVFNKLDYTLVCLAALAASTDVSGYEVIVVDDASTDGTAERMSRIQGVRYVGNATNQGFIGSCNRGASLALGQFLVFLNNDTAVESGWLDALLDTFETHRNAGLVGAKLLYPNGVLQEAGGILYADGRAGNYGRFDAALDPRYTYVREVDYCSGAAIAIRKPLFERLGGFDDRYRPAYYEDADLAMRVREAGYKVLYQPRSIVVHFEGITSGTSESGGVKAYQATNRQVFYQRWRERLASDHPAWGVSQDVAVSKQARTLLVFESVQSAVSAQALVFRMLDDGRSLVIWLNRGTLPPLVQQRLEGRGVEVRSGYWRMSLRGWVRRHRGGLGEIWVMPPADLKRYEQLLRHSGDRSRMRAG